MNVADFSGVTLHSSGFPEDELPVLYFGDWHAGESYFSVTPQACGEYRRVPRGSGPDITHLISDGSALS